MSCHQTEIIVLLSPGLHKHLDVYLKQQGMKKKSKHKERKKIDCTNEYKEVKKEDEEKFI